MSGDYMSDFELPDQQRIVIRNTSENKQSSPVEPGGYVILFILGLAAYLWNFIDNWQDQQSLARYLLAFYDYSIIEPLRLIPLVYKYFLDLDLTPFSNLNWFIAILAMGFYSLFFLPLLIATIFNFLRRIKLYDHRWKIFLFPATLYVIFHFVSWLLK